MRLRSRKTPFFIHLAIVTLIRVLFVLPQWASVARSSRLHYRRDCHHRRCLGQEILWSFDKARSVPHWDPRHRPILSRAWSSTCSHQRSTSKLTQEILIYPPPPPTFTLQRTLIVSDESPHHLPIETQISVDHKLSTHLVVELTLAPLTIAVRSGHHEWRKEKMTVVIISHYL